MTNENPEFGEVGYRFPVNTSATIINVREERILFSARRLSFYDVQVELMSGRWTYNQFVMKDLRKNELIALVTDDNADISKEAERISEQIRRLQAELDRIKCSED